MLRYFAYGSNVNHPHLRQWLAKDDVDPDHLGDQRHAIRPDYRLRTNYHSVVHGAGAENIEAAEGHTSG